MKLTQCEYCGDDLGYEVERVHGEPAVCGKRECERWVWEEAQAEREEAHERLDRDMGW